MKSSRLPLFLSIAVICGILIGVFLAPGINSDEKGNRYSEYNTKSKAVGKLKNLFDLINTQYVEDVDNSKLVEAAINETLKQLDPHSAYIPASDLDAENEVLDGKFEGIGIQFRLEKDTIYVIAAIAGGPSQKAGVIAGDRIVKINDSVVAGIGIADKDIIKKLKGKKGTRVNISIKRNGLAKLLDFDIIRDVIPTYSVEYSGMLSKTTGYIKLGKFSATTHSEFKKAVSELKGGGMDKLILDLRGNSGGFLDQAIGLSDELLPTKDLIVYTEGKYRKRSNAYASGGGLFEKGAVYVMIDEFSASASEIVAGAIQDNDRGVIVGRRSFGKGLVQEQFNLEDKSAVRLTVARYHTPSGRCIQRPYEKGSDEYYIEYLERLSSADTEVKDTVHSADTVQYKTKEGRIVYGGGGITPDTVFSHKKDSLVAYYNTILRKGLIYKFCFEYVDANRNKFSKNTDYKEFIQNFNVSSRIFNDFIKYAETNGVARDDKAIQKYGREILTLMKAYIVQNIYDDKAFYKVYIEMDNDLQETLKLIDRR